MPDRTAGVRTPTGRRAPDSTAARAGSTGSRPAQPWLHDLVMGLEAPTQLWVGRDGQVRTGGAQGVYHGDVRVLSRAELLVGDVPPAAVLVTPDGASGVLAVGLARDLGDPLPDPTVRVDRRWRVLAGRVDEELTLSCTALEPVATTVRVLLECDLAGMDEVKAGRPGGPRTPHSTDRTADGGAGGGVRWAGEGVDVVVAAAGADVVVRPDHVELAWSVTVPRRSTVRLSWSLESVDRRATVASAPPSPSGPSTWAPDVRADDRRLDRWVRRATADLGALRMTTAAAPDEPFLAAGAPWFLTLFGRDSLWAARMLLPLGTDLAGSTLRVLASHQGRDRDSGSAEEPGKILHELRRDAVDLPDDPGGPLFLPPVYYGTVDATALWVCLLHDTWRWGLPDHEVSALLPALEAGLGWMVEHGDADGDGFLEYVDSSGRGLTNQGWKDSWDSVQWQDGRLAEPPIALCEVQGYAYEAAVSGAALLEAFDRPGADRWRSWADGLSARFRDRFWVTDSGGPYPAIALDAAKRPVDSLTSNAGHLLGTGLLDAAEEAEVIRRLAEPDMDSGFGLRTLSAAAAGYAPLSYHGGSVWPHDTAIVLTGMARGGHTAEAASLVEGLLTAAEAFGGRMPELYGGDARGDVPSPVPYPAACRPQAWSAAAAVAVLGAVTGLRPDVPAGRLEVTPLRPSPVGALHVGGLRVAGDEVTVDVDPAGDAVVTRAARPAAGRRSAEAP